METTTQPQQQPVTINYQTSVLVGAGWRAIRVTALARPVGRGLAEVEKVLDVDGNEPDCAIASRTGAKRQTYRPAAIARREIGQRKRLSACALL